MSSVPARHAEPRSGLAERYAAVRAATLALAAPLSEADCQAQSMPDASPAKWHLAHVTWFFETFVLERFEAGFRPVDPAFRVLFNSYYHAVGDQHPRAQRGLITRPGLAEVRRYRSEVDARMAALLARKAGDESLAAVVELGLQHEQQHQELLLTDIKHLLACNPQDVAYLPPLPARPRAAATTAAWWPFEGGRVAIGHDGDGFAFDNESPRHDTLLRPYGLAGRLVSEGDWLAFIDDGGYRNPRWWLSAGWDWVRQVQAQAPLYWMRDLAGHWSVYTLRGRRSVDAEAPVAHLSYFEADAYARWRSVQGGDDVRLPTEAEWEAAARLQPTAQGAGNFVESGALHPLAPAGTARGPAQLFGDVWEWTASSYLPYPGYRAWAGAVGEYNGKFMINQMVLRGGSCATPASHIRASYRNFFPTDARWQFTGLRLARDV
jgi:ergothioneine biosynthesis protein EgtB